MAPGAFTGELLESSLLGKTEEERPPYLDYLDSVSAVREMQPRTDSEIEPNPSDPETPFSNDLHATLAERLELEDYNCLRFYTAVGSALDYYHGVDGFFDYYREDGTVVTVTFDVTKNPHKDEAKADVVLFIDENMLFLDSKNRSKSEYKKYLKLLDDCAFKLGGAISAKLRSADRRKAA